MDENNSKGLGDTIKKVTEFLGIPQCDECKERQEYLNNLVPYSKPETEISKENIALIKSYLEQVPTKFFCVKLNDLVHSLGAPKSDSCFCYHSEREQFYRQTSRWLNSKINE